MTGYYYLISLIVAVILFGAGFLVYRKIPSKFALALKILSVTLFALLFVRYCLADDNIDGIYNLTVERGFTSKGWLAFALFQVWFMFTAELLLCLYPFFKIKLLDNLASFFALAVFVMNFAFMSNHILAIDGEQALAGVTVRGAMIAAETGIGLAYSAGILLKSVKTLKLNGRQLLWFALSLLAMIVCTMPNYTLQLLFNPNKYTMDVTDLNVYHRMYLYPIIIIPIVLYLLLKDRTYEVKKFTLLYYSLAILYGFTLTHKFADFSSVGNWPLHLCNTALYITPLCLIFNWKKFFYFTYFINVLGAFLALTMPNFGYDGLGGSILMSGTLGFFRDHYQAFFMPLLVVGLGVFERPKLKQYIYSMVGFAGYYLLVLILNAWFTNYDASVDYFFINSDFVADKLGSWAERLRDVVWSFDIGSLNFKFYPVYQVLYFTVYFAAALAMWFIYELGYEVVRGWTDIARRKKKIKVDALALDAALNGRSIEEPMNMETVNKLVLNNFSKRYGKSDVYAVKDACLEVDGGDIFGFLGPNGAGKSTIIKSVVGIQPITEGGIEVCGYDVAKQPVQAKRRIGYVPDHYALYERLTAREYINYIADLYEVSQEDRDERLERFIRLFEFETAIDNPIKTYSHGMKQKVTIMAALIHNPEVWILDEPLTGLDPNSIFQVKECMKQHAAAGNIVFFSSHIIDVVERICDKIAIIKKGQILCVRDVRELEESGAALEDFYMDVINKSSVEAVAVEDAEKEKQTERKRRKRKNGGA